MKRSLSLAGPAVVLILFTGGPLQAQMCGDLDECAAHEMPKFAFQIYDYPHNDCRLCPGSGGDQIELCHFPCNQTDDDEETRVAYTAVLRAAQEGQVLEVIRLGASVDERVMFNEDRRAVQVMSCDGAVVASLPVRGLLALARASQLPRASTTLAFRLPTSEHFLRAAGAGVARGASGGAFR